MSEPFLERLKIAQNLLAKYKVVPSTSKGSALLLSAALEKHRSGDTAYRYRANSNIFYLTGSTEGNFTLLLRSDASPILYAPPISAHELRWEGHARNPENLAKKLKSEVKLKEADTLPSLILEDLKGYSHLFIDGESESLAVKIAKRFIAQDLGSRYPTSVSRASLLLGELRQIKSVEEIKSIEESVDIAERVLLEIIPQLKSGMSEKEVKNLILSGYAKFGAEESFNTIVAAGKNGAYLHYRGCTGRLSKGAPLLIDTGCEVALYCSDLTRTLPIGGFTPLQEAIYEYVHEAYRAVCSLIRPGVEYRQIQEKCVEVLVKGLRRLKILNGPVGRLIKEKSYLPFFPHSIGHSLGLDVHDVSPLRDTREGILKAGMVLTVEPGLYFTKESVRKFSLPFAPMGFRLENDIAVTSRGARLLGGKLPIDLRGIKELTG
jgi:Xaa-Pro aminopeptidase